MKFESDKLESIRSVVNADPKITRKALAEMFSISTQTVSRALERLDMDLEHHLRAVPCDADLRQQLPTMSAREASKQYGVTEHVVRRHAKRLGLDLVRGNWERRQPPRASSLDGIIATLVEYRGFAPMLAGASTVERINADIQAVTRLSVCLDQLAEGRS